MKHLLLILLCFPVLSGFAQSNFSVGLATSLDRTATDPNYVSEYHKAGLGYSAGIRVRYDLNNWLSMQTGLGMASASYGAEGETLFNDRVLQTFVAQPGPHPDRFSEKVDIKTFQVPVLFSGYFGNKFKFGFTAGTALNKSYQTTHYLTLYYKDGNPSEEHTTFKDDVVSIYFSGIVGLGCEYSFGKFRLRMEPNVQYFSLNTPSYWSLGLGLSGYYRF